MATALIIGVSGQDGGLLAHFLIGKGYRVVGTSRDADAHSFAGLAALGILDRVERRSMNTAELGSILATLESVEPDEIYNLGGQSSVGLSFEQPTETLNSIVFDTQNILEAMRLRNSKARFYSASSSECFGDTPDIAANENTPFRPVSPYAVAKSCAFWQVSSYRASYGLFAVSGILFNHESRLRPARFVTSKLLHAAQRIANGSKEKLVLGNTSIIRDWGYAPEYVEAMWAMLQQVEPQDYVIATGVSQSLHSFAKVAFAEFDLDIDEYLTVDKRLFRPTDIRVSRADPARAASTLGWMAKTRGEELVKRLVFDLKAGGSPLDI